MTGYSTFQPPRRLRPAASVDVCARVRRVVVVGLAAGLAGGLAEIGWIGLYDLAGGVSSRTVAGEIARTFTWMPAAEIGVLIHMLAALVLGIMLAAVLRLPRIRFADPVVEAVAVVGFLAAIWGFNFHLLGPAVAPDFVALLPDSVSLASKFLFGLAAAAVFGAERWLAAAFTRRASC